MKIFLVLAGVFVASLAVLLVLTFALYNYREHFPQATAAWERSERQLSETWQDVIGLDNE